MEIGIGFHSSIVGCLMRLMGGEGSGCILSFRLMVGVLGIAFKLLATPRSRIYAAGSARTSDLLRRFAESARATEFI